jgi:uncharacterized membrane protein YhaH (DUF805 family)
MVLMILFIFVASFSFQAELFSKEWWMVVIIAALIISTLRTRRAHDIGASGLEAWFYIKDWALLVKLGQRKENRYGKPPKPKIDVKALIGLPPSR